MVKNKVNKGNKEERVIELEMSQAIIDLARVTRVMAGGKRMRFRAAVVIGDRKSSVGTGVAKGADVTIAINKAVAKARKNLIRSPIFNETIPCKIQEKFKAAKILLKPAPAGTGIIAGGAMRQVLELSGIKNVVGKNLGSNNKINIVSATMQALGKLDKMVEKRKSMFKKEKSKKESEEK
ncbi:MAG: 30S ribosomal protein S5 [bacterium]